MAGTKEGQTGKPEGDGMPWLEYVAAATGAALALFFASVIVVEAWTGDDSKPDIALEMLSVQPGSGGFAAEILAANRGSKTAADVRVEGHAGEETGETTFDFVPGGSERKGTVVFRMDPGPNGVELRVLGYREP
jgi:uncharacterized protein (TIGR02588 family)